MVKRKPQLGRYTFKKADRLLKHREFKTVSRTGKKMANADFIVIASRGTAGRTRLGITVSKKVGCAVVRNRIKRSAREFFRLNRQQIHNCWDVNLIAKKSAAALTTKEIFASLGDIVEKTVRKPNN